MYIPMWHVLIVSTRPRLSFIYYYVRGVVYIGFIP